MIPIRIYATCVGSARSWSGGIDGLEEGNGVIFSVKNTWCEGARTGTDDC